jgi:hypothetical protein
LTTTTGISLLPLLRKIHNNTSKFESRPISEWNQYGHEWFGLFSEMERRLDLHDAEMGFVHNPSGGFVGCWWNFLVLTLAPGCEAYLQCEEHALCFKVAVDGKSDRSKVRDRFSVELLNAAQQLGFPAKRPERFGSGTYMTVALMDGDYRRPQGEGILNWNWLTQTLVAAKAVLELAVRNCSSLNEEVAPQEVQ